MPQQHHKPCKTCPFTSKVLPGELGGSAPEVYVGQHFMPYRVPCHEFVDYDVEDWKEGARQPEIPQCVGFAMCRNGDETDKIMPDALLKAEHDSTTGAFEDIWDFWAFHKNMSRNEALIDLNPLKIMECCTAEIRRQGAKLLDVRDGTTVAGGQGTIMVLRATEVGHEVWKKAISKEMEFFYSLL